MGRKALFFLKFACFLYHSILYLTACSSCGKLFVYSRCFSQTELVMVGTGRDELLAYAGLAKSIEKPLYCLCLGEV